jgi:tetratricopeptide (TPR) repeat protein
VLGQGGFGIVYLAFNRVTKSVCALKTFSDELLTDRAGLEAFKKEALLWVNLDRHPFILAAMWVEEFYGRLFVEMDYVAPDACGRVTLADHLEYAGRPLETVQTLRWAVHFCVGMGHIHGRGIECHGDIKPTNILITQDGTLKICDFGLAQAAEAAWFAAAVKGGSRVWRRDGETIGFSLVERDGKLMCGTPGYMAPEVYRGEQSDVRSDVYSFGLVLWQMATGSRAPPFLVPYRGDLEDYLRGIYEHQMTRRAPRVDGFLGPVIERCLRPNPAERFGSFAELRRALDPILERTAGKKPESPQVGEKTAAFWISKGSSLANLGRREEAMNCLDRALEIDPRNLIALSNKGTVLIQLGRLAEAITCFDKVLAIDPRNGIAWNEKGRALANLNRCEEAISCHDEALIINSRDALAWSNKGRALAALGRFEDGMRCDEQALAIDPQDATAWYNKGAALTQLKRHEEAIRCYDRALAINPENTFAWNNKATALGQLRRHEEAIGCVDRALAVDPRDTFAWTNKGVELHALGRRDEAISCYRSALAIDPRHTLAWLNKAYSEDALGRKREAALSYRKFIELAPRQYSEQIARARQRLIELESMPL